MKERVRVEVLAKRTRFFLLDPLYHIVHPIHLYPQGISG